MWWELFGTVTADDNVRIPIVDRFFIFSNVDLSAVDTFFFDVSIPGAEYDCGANKDTVDG